MKKLVSLSFALLAVLAFKSNAQDNIKLGHINSQELFQAMPESDSAQKILQKSAKEIEETLEQLQVEFNQKYEDYMQNVDSYSDLIRSTKEQELQQLQQRIQQFQAQAEQDLQNQRTKLLQPIQEKALKAVNDVAEENGFTYIFDSSLGAIVYSAENTKDILPLVKAKLGIE